MTTPTNNELGPVEIVAVTKGADKYFFFWSPECVCELSSTLARFASNPELNFNWYDAAVVSQQIRRRLRECSEARL